MGLETAPATDVEPSVLAKMMQSEPVSVESSPLEDELSSLSILGTWPDAVG